MNTWIAVAFSCLVVVAIEPEPTQAVAPAVVAAGAATVRVVAPVARKVVPAVKQVFHKYATRKAAKEAAQRASRGVNPVGHGPHKPGYNPHFHQTKPNFKPSDFTIKRPPGSDKSYRIHEHFQYPRKQG